MINIFAKEKFYHSEGQTKETSHIVAQRRGNKKKKKKRKFNYLFLIFHLLVRERKRYLFSQMNVMYQSFPIIDFLHLQFILDI